METDDFMYGYLLLDDPEEQFEEIHNENRENVKLTRSDKIILIICAIITLVLFSPIFYFIVKYFMFLYSIF